LGFTSICFPHADDAAGFTALRPNDHDNAAVESARCGESIFSVVRTIIPPSEVLARENFTCAGEIQPAFGQCLVAFLGVELDLHWNKCTNKKTVMQVVFVSTKISPLVISDADEWSAPSVTIANAD